MKKLYIGIFLSGMLLNSQMEAVNQAKPYPSLWQRIKNNAQGSRTWASSKWNGWFNKSNKQNIRNQRPGNNYYQNAPQRI
ncbi:hypothetical protein [Candidatus Babela massiliensis]|uniref:Uncharacterized protein n=1 Tax=Candidatus Babela massiliensis TaxID=673862 RepID=V6DFB5_9BACT|nr:hypothetical protein [Candidatus Babela massiliensis]CDK30265.1 hypothetical protein BABL1_gene_959 [Candidatus Babela massiliensis]